MPNSLLTDLVDGLAAVIREANEGLRVERTNAFLGKSCWLNISDGTTLVAVLFNGWSAGYRQPRRYERNTAKYGIEMLDLTCPDFLPRLRSLLNEAGVVLPLLPAEGRLPASPLHGDALSAV